MGVGQQHIVAERHPKRSAPSQPPSSGIRNGQRRHSRHQCLGSSRRAFSYCRRDETPFAILASYELKLARARHSGTQLACSATTLGLLQDRRSVLAARRPVDRSCREARRRVAGPVQDDDARHSAQAHFFKAMALQRCVVQLGLPPAITARSDVLVLSICAAVLAMVAIRQFSGDHARDVMWWLSATLVLAAGMGVMLESRATDGSTHAAYYAPHRHTPAPLAELPRGLAAALLTAQPSYSQASDAQLAPAPTAPMSVSATTSRTTCCRLPPWHYPLPSLSRGASCAPSPPSSRASYRTPRAPPIQPSNPPQSPAPSTLHANKASSTGPPSNVGAARRSPPSPPHTPKPSSQPPVPQTLSPGVENNAVVGAASIRGGRLACMQRQREDAMALAAVAMDGSSHKRTRAPRIVVELAQIPDISTAISSAQPGIDFDRAGSTISSAVTAESAYERSVAARFRRMRL